MADHPVKVPEELVKEWAQEIYGTPGADTGDVVMADRAAQWGADQELEACWEWVGYPVAARQLRSARRPKLPTLAEQGMEALRGIKSGTNNCREQDQAVAWLTAALNRLADLEAQQ